MINHRAPHRSVIQPVRGDSIPPSNLPIPEATDVTVRLKPNSDEIGLKRAERP